MYVEEANVERVTDVVCVTATDSVDDHSHRCLGDYGEDFGRAIQNGGHSPPPAELVA